MAGEDTTSAQLSAPPRPPLPPQDCTPQTLRRIGDEVVAATLQLGLPHWFWPEGVALTGMTEFASACGNPFPDAVSHWFEQFATRDLLPDHINDVAPGTAAVRGVAAGAGIDAGVLERLYSWLTTSPAATRDADGTWEHWPGGVWADTVYMAGLFVGELGILWERADLVELFGRQLMLHLQRLQHPTSGLCAHGSHRGETIWCHWGRANAWIALAGVEYLQLARTAGLAELDVTVQVRAALTRQLLALLDHQPPHGVWSVLVDDQVENAGILETSAAAGIGAAMIRAGALLPELPVAVRAAGELAVRGALAYVDDGILTRVSAGTVLQLVPFGYSVIRDDRPQLYGQGLMLQGISALLQRVDTPGPGV